MNRKRITISDIARQAGVSPSTVSRVISGSARVAEEKQTAVTAAIEALGYRPNVMAQGLARGESLTIGVLTQDIGSPFYGEILRGIEEGLYGTAYYPLFASASRHREKHRAATEMLISRGIDALIIVHGGELSDSYVQEVAEKVPVIVVGRAITGYEDHCLRVDDFEAARSATHYLIELGHRRIAHITGIPSHQDAYDRREGYCQALAESGLAMDPGLIVEGDFIEKSGIFAVETLFTRGKTFSAIFAANDQLAYGARLALFRRGIRVPEDVSIVGFDDQFYSTYMTPPLTTVRQPTREMGLAAAEAVLRCLQGQPPTLPHLPAELVLRESATIYQGSR